MKNNFKSKNKQINWLMIILVCVLPSCIINKPALQFDCIDSNQIKGVFEKTPNSFELLAFFIILNDTIGYMKIHRNDVSIFDTLKLIAGRKDPECIEQTTPYIATNANSSINNIKGQKDCDKTCPIIYRGNRATIYSKGSTLFLEYIDDYCRGLLKCKLDDYRKEN